MQPDGFGCCQERVHRLLLDFAVPRLKLFVCFRNAGTVLIARSKHHRQVIAELALRILPKEDHGALLLLVTPFTLGLEQHISAPGQKLFGGIAGLLQDWGKGLAGLPCVLDGVVLLLEGRAPQLDPDVLHGLGDQLLNMEAIRHELRAGEGLLDGHLHIRRHIQGHLGDGVPRVDRAFREHRGKITGCRALNHRHESALLPVGRLVRQGGPELAVCQGPLVDTQLGAEILGKEHPVLGMLVRLPGREATEVVFVLLLEFLGLQLGAPGNGGERDRLSLGLVLLKKLQTPAPIGCRGNRVGWHASNTQPGLPASHRVVGRSAVCVSLAGENP